MAKETKPIEIVDEMSVTGEMIVEEKELAVHDTPIFYEGGESPFASKMYAHDGMTIDELMGKPAPPEDAAFVIIQDGGVGDAGVAQNHQ